jgi:hypothetical protein
MSERKTAHFAMNGLYEAVRKDVQGQNVQGFEADSLSWPRSLAAC